MGCDSLGSLISLWCFMHICLKVTELKKDELLLFCFVFYCRHNNHFQSESMVTMQTICSILVTHLIYKLAGCMLSLWQTGFLLTSRLPDGATTFPPHFEQQSHALYPSCTNRMLCVKETLCFPPPYLGLPSIHRLPLNLTLSLSF